MLALIVLPQMLAALLLGFLFSVFSLFWAWQNGPKLGKNSMICFIGIVLGIFLWIAIILPLFEVSVGANNLDELDKLLLYLVIFGATPSAAFPALLLYGPSKKSTKPKQD